MQVLADDLSALLLRVPPAMASCAQAVAWTFGTEGAKAREFAPAVET
jgi:hypothetical protein